MKRLTLLCISPLILANVAIAGGQNAPMYTEGHPHHHHHHKPHHFRGFSVTGGLGGMAAELDAKQVFDGDVQAGDIDPSDDTDFFVNNEVEFNNSVELFEGSIAGMVGVEYAWQFDNGLVLGLAATAGFENIQFNNTDDVNNFVAFAVYSATDPDVTPIGAGNLNSAGGNTLKVELENDFAVLFKPGFVLKENTLVYLLVGPRWGNFETSLDSTLVQNGSVTGTGVTPGSWGPTGFATSTSNSEYEIGITAGVGVRQALTDHFHIGLEYAYTHYSDIDSLTSSFGPFTTEPANPTPELAFQFDSAALDMIANTHTVMGTLSYRF